MRSQATSNRKWQRSAVRCVLASVVGPDTFETDQPEQGQLAPAVEVSAINESNTSW